MESYGGYCCASAGFVRNLRGFTYEHMGRAYVVIIRHGVSLGYSGMMACKIPVSPTPPGTSHSAEVHVLPNNAAPRLRGYICCINDKLRLRSA